MKNKKLQGILEDIGLSENEARVYLAALAIGPTTILRVAKAAEIKRTTAYSVVESLKQRGLMNIELRGFKQLFAAEDPEKMRGILETRKEKFIESLPEFSSLYNLKGGGGIVKYYEGLESVKNVYERLLHNIQSGEDYLAISNASQWKDLDEKWFEKFMENRARLPINIRLLLQDSVHARQYEKFARNYNFAVKILPKSTTLSTSTTITPQRVVIHQLIPPVMAIVIENESIIKTHREMFEIMWNALPLAP